MRMIIILVFVVTLTSLSACSSMRGNVVPQSGPPMEQVYDSANGESDFLDSNNPSNQENLNNSGKEVNTSQTPQKTFSLSSAVSGNAVSREFRKLKNPELYMYVYPHLAGRDQVPIPGYYTAFNVYDHDYYALANE